jgi:TolB-like protein
MKLKFFSILTFALVAVAVVAADAPLLTVAVYDFKGAPGAGYFGGKVTPLITADLATETNFVMVARAELDKALNEQAFGVSGMVSSDAAAKIGQITGAKVLVAGEIVKTDENHLVIIADIIGTETGRLFADKVEGAPDKLLQLTADLSRKIAQTITDQATNLVAPPVESHEDWLNRIAKSVTGTNRPSVSVNILWSRNMFPGVAINGEWGIVLMKAGFPVVDKNSDRKPDITITGVYDNSQGPRHGELFSYRTTVEVKIQDRRTGNIIAFDRQESSFTDAAKVGADRSCQVNAVDALAERILPLLAK